jgi:hypothetical protein
MTWRKIADSRTQILSHINTTSFGPIVVFLLVVLFLFLVFVILVTIV